MFRICKLVLPAGIIVLSALAADLPSLIGERMNGLQVHVSPKPFSRTIERIYIGYDKTGEARTAIAMREIESYKPLTGVVIVEKAGEGYLLKEALFPDIGAIRNPKDRQEVNKLLRHFREVVFDPHAERSAVDVVSGATRYTAKTAGYFNYMARQAALQMELQPDWPEQQP